MARDPKIHEKNDHDRISHLFTTGGKSIEAQINAEAQMANSRSFILSAP